MADKRVSFTLYKNPGGPDVAVTSKGLVEKDGLVFRDLAGTGELLPYEDWRLDPVERACDLVARLSVEELAGLMLYSPHQMVPSLPGEPFQATYGGKAFPDAGVDAWALTDEQKAMVEKDKLRHVLAMKLQDARTAALWNNELQALAEAQPWGIPVNISSDPRHSASAAGAEFKTAGGGVSKWPDSLGVAATFDPEIASGYGEAVAAEYRALGIATALGPQIDVATEPRWMRFEDTFGTNPAQVTRVGAAYIDALQTTTGSETGWGPESVAAMCKHWPGGAPVEGGRDAHYPFGKFAIYPGESFKEHVRPFAQGAFALDGPTRFSAAVMPYYTVSWNRDIEHGENVGNSYSQYLVKDLLRGVFRYDGVVCTDWNITADPAEKIDSFGSRCYGEEGLTEAERHLKIMMNHVDQFGGESDPAPVLAAYELGCERIGEDAMRARMEASASRILTSMFRLGLFENPYLDAEKSAAVVGCDEYVRAGYAAQLASVVLLKNEAAALPQTGRRKVYVPVRHVGARKGFFRTWDEAKDIDPVDAAVLDAYYDRVDTPEEADFALVFIESPLSVEGGYSEADAAAGGNGYVPVSLQYRPYVAANARGKSVAGGDPREADANRSYRGKSVRVANESDLDLVLAARKDMGDKPVVVVVRSHNPFVPAEFEPAADAVLVDFGVQPQAVLDIVSGAYEPSGLLPVDLPADMETVEKHSEDTPFDYAPYVDAAGNAWRYAYGMDWSGRIDDARAARYPVQRS